jgi:hypothetical protein
MQFATGVCRHFGMLACDNCGKVVETPGGLAVHIALSRTCEEYYVLKRTRPELHDLSLWERIVAGQDDQPANAQGYVFPQGVPTQQNGLEDLLPPTLSHFKQESTAVAEIIGLQPRRTFFHKILQDEAVFDDNIFHPFSNEAEWEVAAWLVEAGLPDAQINQFLNLSYVSHFQSAKFR